MIGNALPKGLMEDLENSVPSNLPYNAPVIQAASKSAYTPATAAARVQAQPLSPEELKGLTWSNWATNNRFDSMPEPKKRALVKQYHDNVLPYVASSLNKDPSIYQQKFRVKYPNESILLESPTKMNERQATADEYGLQGEERKRYILTGNINKPSNEVNAGLIEERRQNLSVIGKDLTDKEQTYYMLTGKLPAPNPLTEVKVGIEQAKEADRQTKNAAELKSEREALLKGIESAEAQMKDATRAADSVIKLLDGGVPASGPASKLIAAYSPIQTDAASLRGYLNTLKASGVFKALQDLRDASANGSSGLGQVTNVEISLLGSRIAALDPDMLDEDQLKAEVKYFKEQLGQAAKDIKDRKVKEQNYFDSATASDAPAKPADASGWQSSGSGVKIRIKGQ